MSNTAVAVQANELTYFQEVLQALNAYNDVSEAFPTILSCLREMTGCERVSLMLLDREAAVYVLTAVEQSGSVLGRGERLPLADSAVTEDLLDGRIHHTPDLATENELPTDKALYQSGLRSRVNFPLKGHQAIIGALNLCWSVPNGLNLDRLPVLTQIVTALALAVERHLLIQQVQNHAIDLEAQINTRVAEWQAINRQLTLEIAERSRVEEVLRTYQHELEVRTESLAIINAIASMVYRSFDTNTIASQAVEAIIANTRFRDVGLFYLDPSATILTLLAQKGFDPNIARRVRQLNVESSLAGYAVRQREVAFSPHLAEDERLDPALRQLLLPHGRQSMVSVPILFQERVLGAFNVTLREVVAEIGEEERSLLLSIGKTIGLAMVNAEYVGRIQTEIQEREQVEEALKIYAAELERSNRELQDFAYVASHDLQEPLRKIQTFADRLQAKYRDVLDERGNEYLQRMQESAGRMRHLIDDLLTFSRVTTAAEPFVELPLTSLVQGVVVDLEAQLERTQGVVNVAVMPEIEGEPAQLRRLFQNLISNALKFHRPGVPPEVRVWAELVNEPGRLREKRPRLCRIYVADNGIGFDDRYRNRIFNLFERLHGRHEYEGTGMGLAICRKIVEHHAGYIEAQGKPGEGATFTITLPVRQNR
jgi:signal transduction histidine kinase